MNLQSRNPAGILIPKIGTASPPPCCDVGAVKAITPAPEMTARSNKAIHLIGSPSISACASNDRLRTGLHWCLCFLMLWEVFCEQQEQLPGILDQDCWSVPSYACAALETTKSRAGPAGEIAPLRHPRREG